MLQPGNGRRDVLSRQQWPTYLGPPSVHTLEDSRLGPTASCRTLSSVPVVSDASRPRWSARLCPPVRSAARVAPNIVDYLSPGVSRSMPEREPDIRDSELDELALADLTNKSQPVQLRNQTEWSISNFLRSKNPGTPLPNGEHAPRLTAVISGVHVRDRHRLRGHGQNKTRSPCRTHMPSAARLWQDRAKTTRGSGARHEDNRLFLGLSPAVTPI